MKVDLLNHEKLVGEFTPRFFSFFHVFSPYVYLLGLSIVFLMYEENIKDLAKYFWVFESLVKPYLSLFFFLVLLILPAIFLAFIHINYKVCIIFGIISAAGMYMQFQGLPATYRAYMLLGIGASGIVLAELHRRSHKYYITNYRVIMERTFPQYSRREIMLEEIQDIAVHQGLLGRIFNFGNVILTSASGVGTGEDAMSSYFGFGTKIPKSPLIMGVSVGGAKGVKVFRARPHNCLFGIPNPRKINNLIMKMKFERSEATKLEEIKRILEKTNQTNSPTT